MIFISFYVQNTVLLMLAIFFIVTFYSLLKALLISCFSQKILSYYLIFGEFIQSHLYFGACAENILYRLVIILSIDIGFCDAKPAFLPEISHFNS